LRVIVDQFREATIRCDKTFRSTHYVVRTWLVSYSTDTTDLKTFKWSCNKTTLTQYFNTWSRLLCTLFQARILHNIDPKLERKVVNMWGKLSDDIRGQIEEIWDCARLIRKDIGGDRLPELPDRFQGIRERITSQGFALELYIQERIMGLSVALVKHPLECVHGPLSDNNPLLHYTGILSMDISAYQKNHGQSWSYVPPSSSTHILSHLVWCACLFSLESVLPKEEYKVLGWKSRDAFKKDLLGRLIEIRTPYLTYASMSVVGKFSSICLQ
jgi:hypothetical protein